MGLAKPWTFFTCGLLLLIWGGTVLISIDQIHLRNRELELERQRSATLKAEITGLRRQVEGMKQTLAGWNDLVLEIVVKEQSDREKLRIPRIEKSSRQIR